MFGTGHISKSYWFKGKEKVQRLPEWKLDIRLRHNYRNGDGKVKAVSVHIGTISYWDFVDDYIDEQFGGSQTFSNIYLLITGEPLGEAYDKLSKKKGLFWR